MGLDESDTLCTFESTNRHEKKLLLTSIKVLQAFYVELYFYQLYILFENQLKFNPYIVIMQYSNITMNKENI